MIERYQTDEMRAIWHEDAKFSRWTRVEVAACAAFHQRGEIDDDHMRIIHERAHHQSAARVAELEKTTDHDVVAFVRAVGESVGEPAARHLHRGLTSSDVVDTGLALAMVESLDVLIQATLALREVIGKAAIANKTVPCVARTHGIHAEPSSFGLRLANWYAELSRNLERLRDAREQARHGKLSGAVGTFSQTDPDFEACVMQELGLVAEPIATQVVPRDRHAVVFATLAFLGGALERFATEIRGLQRTEVREVEEPFGRGQTGSSAMPHKRNPIGSERITGMARLLRGYMLAACENISLWHERDISHSSVERVALPDAFHLCHYMLRTLKKIMEGLRVYPAAMRENLQKTRGLVFSQSVLGLLLSAGMDRQEAYAVVQRAAMRVWEGQESDFKASLASEPPVMRLLSPTELDAAFDLNVYTRHASVLFARAGIEE